MVVDDNDSRGEIKAKKSFHQSYPTFNSMHDPPLKKLKKKNSMHESEWNI